jgi:hypothetical protein
MQRTTRVIIAAAATAVAIGGWYAFRPERLFVDQVVSEGFDTTAVALSGDTVATSPATAAAIAAGAFHSNAHETRGMATVYRRADGSRTLRLTQFETSNGPDVRVYLVAAADVNDDATVKRAGFVELGRLKGNVGDQNYDIPASVDLSKYASVTIWCARFSVNFGTAPLNVQG